MKKTLGSGGASLISCKASSVICTECNGAKGSFILEHGQRIWRGCRRCKETGKLKAL